MLKVIVVLVLTCLASGALAQSSAPRAAPQAAAIVAPARAADSAGAGDERTAAPSFFDFLTSGGLVNIATYCATDAPDKPNRWLQGFICEARVTDVAIAIYLGLLLVVVVGLVLLGIMQYDLLARTSREQLRAYLLVESAMRLGEHDDHPEFQMVIKNFGQTPAYHVRTWIAVWPGERGSQVVLPGPEKAIIETSDAALGPGGSFELSRRYAVDWEPEKFADFSSGKTAMHIYGEVSYRDAFRKRRYTRFRAMYGAEHFRTGGVAIAARGNEST